MTRLFTYGLASAATIFLYPIYFLSGLSPRRLDLWVFGSWGGHRFADNAAAFYLYCSSHVGDAVELVWISRRLSIVSKLRSQGYKAHWVWSPRGVQCCARAGVFVFDCYSKDINFWLSRNALKVNLWSGVPLKTIERDIDQPSNRYYKLFHGSLPVRCLYRYLMPWHVDRVDLFICTAPVMQKIICRAFDVTEEKVAITGYPRTDVFFLPDDAQVNPLSGLPKPFVDTLNAGQRIFIYLPTFRDSGKPYMAFDWARLDEFLSHHNAKLFYKLHPVSRGEINHNLGNIIGLEKNMDIYNMLKHVNVLISDYSSVIFDFMLLDRPIIYYTPDLQEYLSSSRALNFNFEDIAVGPQCETFEELLAAMDLVLQDTRHKYETLEQRTEIAKHIHSHFDGDSSSRVLQVLCKQVLKGRLNFDGAKTPKI